MKKALTLMVAALVVASAALRAETPNSVVLDIEPSSDNPRNSEGAFVALRSGRIAFYYTQFYGGASDFSPARIVAIESGDGGRTWGAPRRVVENGGRRNVMSVSLLRLRSGRLGLFYGIKNSAWDNRPCARVSSDEGATWSEPVLVVASPGYYSRNNDRVIQTGSGRLIFPVAFHRPLGSREGEAMDSRGLVLWFLSDDEGGHWHEAGTWWASPAAGRCGLQEPGVVELADGSLFSWARTDLGRQFGFRSRDDGATWTAPEPTELASPCSPASIRRLPGSDALLAIYNDHSGRFPAPADLERRTPLVAAISRDGGRTWPARRLLENAPAGRFCYTAIFYTSDAVLLAYDTGTANAPGFPWGRLRLRRISLAWLGR